VTLLSETEFLEAVLSYEHTATRLELQLAYAERHEAPLFAAFLAGAPQQGPADDPELQAWYASVAEHTAAGARMERVRVHEDPPTDYQRFERSLDPWNIQAGEVVRYMTRKRAHEVGLLPAAGDADWWLIDSSELIVMRFDPVGHRMTSELTTDPEAVLQACKWRDLAVHHSVQRHLSDATA
jgi:hypothetical protein